MNDGDFDVSSNEDHVLLRIFDDARINTDKFEGAEQMLDLLLLELAHSIREVALLVKHLVALENIGFPEGLFYFREGLKYFED